MTLWRVGRLGRRGDGVAVAADGSRALAARVLPGETIEGEAGEDGRIVQPRIVAPSPERVAAPCPHYRACGGCALQHAGDGFVAGWKARLVESALAAQGIEAQVGRVHSSPPRSRRRAVFAGRRTKKGALVGFHARASGMIADLADCLVVRPEIRDALPLLREITVAGASRSGELDLAVTHGPAGLDIAVSGGRPADAALLARLAELAEAGDLARLDWNGEAITRRASWQPMGAARVVPPPGGFLQATAEGEAALVGFALAGAEGAARVLDLYAGCGTFALPLAARAEVHAVEGSGPALAALDAGWRGAPGLRRVTTEIRDLARRPLAPDELGRADAIVIDPPRAGAEAQARAIAASGLGRAVWISCDPVTFARDARLMVAGGWRIAALEVIDQFRWSPHVETAALFLRGQRVG